jgi:hypothetical protein
LRKQILELVALIGMISMIGLTVDKYPTRTFAVSGSSVQIAYPAFIVFLKEHVIRKMGGLIPMEILSRLHIINGNILPGFAYLDMPVSGDLKRGRFGDALKEIVVDKAHVISLLIQLLKE